MRWPTSLHARLLTAYLAAWLGTALLVSGGVLIYLRGDPMRWADHSGAELAQRLTGTLGQDADGRLTLAPPPEVVRWLSQALPQELGWRVFDAEGRVLAWSSPATQADWSAAGLPARPQGGPGRTQVAGRPLRTWTQAAELPRGTVWLQVGASERLIALIHSGTTMRLGGTMVVTAVLSILLLGVVQFFVLRQLMRPVRRLSREAEDIAHLPDRRLDLAGLPAELQPLVQAFNQSLDSVQLGFERQLRFLADAAHEFKTPLALLRAQVELGEKPAVLLEDIDHMTRQVQQLLLLAEVSEPHSYRREPLDVAAVVDDVSRYLQPLALRHRVRLWTDTAAPPPGLLGDRDALFALVKNLAENAISCSPAGSTVQLTVSPEALVVRDHGNGIAPAHFEHLFKRFWRAPSRRDRGAGLGLAICEAVSRAHGWRITVRNVQPGAEFSLLFSPTP
jgi:signal transduction histidine kinase